jgi:UDPglucose 6-dehydrogenase
VALDNARGMLGKHGGVTFVNSAKEAVQGADALAVVTEWLEFRSPDFSELSLQLKAKVVFDGRNLYEPAAVKAAGLTYYGIGRGQA